MILAIDPGTDHSAFIVLREDMTPLMFGLEDNQDVLQRFRSTHGFGGEAEQFAVEMFASYGKPVGQTTFEACVWIGRFIDAWESACTWHSPDSWHYVYRFDVKMHLCKQSAKVTDAMVRRAVMDRYPRTGGGANPEIGTKKKPGPLYGIKADIWQALAVGITYQETMVQACQ